MTTTLRQTSLLLACLTAPLLIIAMFDPIDPVPGSIQHLTRLAYSAIAGSILFGASAHYLGMIRSSPAIVIQWTGLLVLAAVAAAAGLL